MAMALMRGFARHAAGTIGNFWVDLDALRRCTLLLRWRPR